MADERPTPETTCLLAGLLAGGWRRWGAAGLLTEMASVRTSCLWLGWVAHSAVMFPTSSSSIAASTSTSIAASTSTSIAASTSTSTSASTSTASTASASSTTMAPFSHPAPPWISSSSSTSITSISSAESMASAPRTASGLDAAPQAT